MMDYEFFLSAYLCLVMHPTIVSAYEDTRNKLKRTFRDMDIMEQDINTHVFPVITIIMCVITKPSNSSSVFDLSMQALL